MENNLLSEEGATFNASDDSLNKNLIEINFNGKAKVSKFKEEENDQQVKFIKSKSNELEYELQTLISLLNYKSNEISVGIKNDIFKLIQELVPTDTDINVEINFRQGSVEFIGLVVVTISQIVDIVSFLDLLKNGVKLIVRKITSSAIETNSPFVVEDINVEIEKYKPRKSSVNIFTRFLWWCGGASSEILEPISRIHSVEKYKFQCIGATVVFTAVLALISSWYALFTVFAPKKLETIDFQIVYICFGLAFVWAMMIFNLDRYIVSSLKKSTGENNSKIPKRIYAFGDELLSALPRILLALGVALIISKPLELRIFESEILTRINSDVTKKVDNRKKEIDEKYQPSIKEKNDEIIKTESKLKSLEDRKNELQIIYIKETDASGGTYKRGVGPVAAAKNIEKIKAENEIERYIKNDKKSDDERIQTIRGEIASIEEAKKTELNEYKTAFSTGILERIKTLAILSEEESSIYYASWAVIFLIIIIELAPVLVKLFLQFSEYDARLEMLSGTFVNDFLYKKEAAIKTIKDRYEKMHSAEANMNETFFEESAKSGNNFTRDIFRTLNLHYKKNSLSDLLEYIKKKIFFN